MTRAITIFGILALQSCIADPNGETVMHRQSEGLGRFTTTCVVLDHGMQRAPRVPSTGCQAGQARTVVGWQWMAPNGDCEATMLAGARMNAIETCAGGDDE